MWAVILSVCTAWMIFNIYYRFAIYLSHPKSVDMMFTYKGQLPFPTVTICNQNNYKASYAYRFCNEPRCRYTTDIERYYDINNSEVYKLLTDFTSTVQARNSGSQDADSKLALFAKYYGSIGVQDLEEFYRITSHNRHHMIRGCTWKSETCTFENFTDLPTDSGLCLSFNLKEDDVLMTNTAGVMGGLRLLLDVEQYNYMKSSTTAAGIFVLIQNKAEAHQLVRNMAYSVSAGFHTNIALRYNKYQELLPPFATCSENVPLTKCHLHCISNYVLAKCGCRDNYMDLNGNTPFCTPNQLLNCSSVHSANLANNETALEECGCVPQCSRATYQATLSQARFSTHTKNIFTVDNEAPQWLLDMCSLQSWDILFIADRRYISYIDEMAKEMQQFHQHVQNIETYTSDIMLDLTFGLSPTRYLYNATEHSTLTRLIYKLENVSSTTLATITNNNLYRFTKYTPEENIIGLDFNMAVAYDVVKRQNLTDILLMDLEPQVELLQDNIAALTSKLSDLYRPSWVDRPNEWERSLYLLYHINATGLVRHFNLTRVYYHLLYNGVYSNHNNIVQHLQCAANTSPQKFYGDNYLQLDIYFENLNEFVLKQNKVDSINSFLCDFGGNLGLCLGGSVLTFYEIFEIAFLYLSKFLQLLPQINKHRS